MVYTSMYSVITGMYPYVRSLHDLFPARMYFSPFAAGYFIVLCMENVCSGTATRYQKVYELLVPVILPHRIFPVYINCIQF